jgi:hypothetical protein
MCVFAGAGNTSTVRARRDADYRLCVFLQIQIIIEWGRVFGKKFF